MNINYKLFAARTHMKKEMKVPKDEIQYLIREIAFRDIGENADVFDATMKLLKSILDHVPKTERTRMGKNIVDALIKFFDHDFDKVEEGMKYLHGYLSIDIWEYFEKRKKAYNQNYCI